MVSEGWVRRGSGLNSIDMFLRHRPSPLEVEAFIAASRQLPLSYAPIGLAGRDEARFHVDEQEVVIGLGKAAFDRAKVALTKWRHFELGWVEVFPRQAAVAPGTVVAVLVRHLGFWSMNGCRVVYEIAGDDSREFGFAYGTLTNHAEIGEEIFKVSLRPRTGEVSYLIRAASRPRALLARLGYPVTRSLQARFRRDSAAAITRATG
jgi:uncharacterized protein (UPF0548 family)